MSSRRPSNMSSRLVGPSDPVASSVASTSVIGSRRRCAATASPACVCAFSATSSSSRAARHSSADTTCGSAVSAWPRTFPDVVVDPVVVIAASFSMSSSQPPPARTAMWGRRGSSPFSPIHVPLKLARRPHPRSSETEVVKGYHGMPTSHVCATAAYRPTPSEPPSVDDDNRRLDNPADATPPATTRKASRSSNRCGAGGVHRCGWSGRRTAVRLLVGLPSRRHGDVAHRDDRVVLGTRRDRGALHRRPSCRSHAPAALNA